MSLKTRSRKTISRNRKSFIASVFEQAMEAREYALENCFHGDVVSAAELHKQMLAYNDMGLEWKISYDADRQEYQVRYHSNRWFVVKSPVKP